MEQFKNWYWIVGNDGTKVYSSNRNTYVPIADSAYQQWLISHGVASKIGSEIDIWYYVSSFLPAWLFNGTTFSQPTATTYTVEQLIAYANIRQWQKAIGGYVATIDGDQVPFSTSPDSLGFISGKVQRLLQADPPATVNWQIGVASFKEISAADFIITATSIADFVQDTFDTLQIVFGEISSDPPSITTVNQIDSAFSS